MNEEENRKVTLAIQGAIKKYDETGIQVAAVLDGDLVIDAWGGRKDRKTGELVDGSTLFPTFSVIKAVTAIALHIQVERGLLDYSMPIAEYWPEFAVNGKETATVYDALTHRLGLPAMPFFSSPELICDWEAMVGWIAAMRPLFEPGTKSAYMSYTFGWVVGELVRRTDGKKRAFSRFVAEEIFAPLSIDALWMGAPSTEHGRIATLENMPPVDPREPGLAAEIVHPLAIPAAIGTVQEVWGRADVRQACIPGAGGFANARSMARFFAMLARGGELDGVRILSEDTVRLLGVPRPPSFYDYTQGMPHTGSIGGLWLATPVGRLPPHPAMRPAGSGRRTVGHPGAGGQIAWADPDNKLAVAIFHNRLLRFSRSNADDNAMLAVGNAVRSALDLSS